MIIYLTQIEKMLGTSITLVACFKCQIYFYGPNNITISHIIITYTTKEYFTKQVRGHPLCSRGIFRMTFGCLVSD